LRNTSPIQSSKPPLRECHGPGPRSQPHPAMSAGARAGPAFARAFARRATRGAGPLSGNASGGGSSGAGGARAGHTAAAARGRARRDLRALPRASLQLRNGPRALLRHPRAACPAMLDMFLHAWDDLEDR
jgi:hypothetical protein